MDVKIFNEGYFSIENEVNECVHNKKNFQFYNIFKNLLLKIC